MIYLDNAATTRVFDNAVDAAANAMRIGFFNPNATYRASVDANAEMERARNALAAAVGAKSDEIYFTSCATEANNWAIERGRKRIKGNVVITAGEHASVYEAAMQLKSRGIDVRVVPLTRGGQVDGDALLAAVDKETALVSVIHVSNETGAVNHIKKLAAAVKAKSPTTVFHSDGVQAVLKTREPISSLGVDLYSASAHKIGAPKGIGFLYVRRGFGIAPLLYGGGQEKNLRSGTQNTPYIAAFAAAAEDFARSADINKIAAIRDRLSEHFIKNGCEIVGSGPNSGFVLCVHVPEVKAEILQNIASDNGVIIGKGSACSGSKRGNRVLGAMGLSEKAAECCIRLSFFVDTELDAALDAARIITECADRIRSGHVK